MTDTSAKHVSEEVLLPYLNGMCNGLQCLKKGLHCCFLFCPSVWYQITFFLFLSNSTPNLLKFYISPLIIIIYIYIYIFNLSIDIFYLNYFIKLKFIFNFLPF